ncbi:AI-2E family transporter [Nonomuraea ferruginea]
MYALIFVGILVVEQQLENHVLQPLIVGRALKFHPLAIILALSVGGILAGIAGAVVAVPVAAVIYRALPELMTDLLGASTTLHGGGRPAGRRRPGAARRPGSAPKGPPTTGNPVRRDDPVLTASNLITRDPLHPDHPATRRRAPEDAP